MLEVCTFITLHNWATACDVNDNHDDVEINEIASGAGDAPWQEEFTLNHQTRRWISG